jgi:hypothetical protein
MSDVHDLLDEAKQAIANGEASLQRAAECIAKAQARGATQRQIAEAVGKSAAWVNQLLKWRAAGYGQTAFGPAKAAQRAAFRQSERAKKSKPKRTTPEQAEAERAKAQAQKAKADAAKAKADAAKAKAEARRAREETKRAEREAYANFFAGLRPKREIHSGDRTLLVKALGMLGSDQDGEVLNAARMAEKLRRKLGMSWEELLISADETEVREAA